MGRGIHYLDGHRICRGLRAGIARVVQQKEYLNRINVFPVPDGDTGTNMAFTLLGITRSTERPPTPAVNLALNNIAEAAIDSSRGNSGAILAQFLQGVREYASNHARLTPHHFVAAVGHGAACAREAVGQPREGTMLTVIQDYAAELSDQLQKGVYDYRVLLQHGLNRARKSLSDTPKKLAVLKQAGVVDAGAQGFVDLLEGVQEYVLNGSVRKQVEIPDAGRADEIDDMSGGTEDLEHRYCTECVITGDAIDRLALRQELASLGSSLVLAGTASKARIHIHVNDPAELFRICERYGTVSKQKADDMERQQHSAHARRQQVAIIADSAVDIPEYLAEEFDIHIVPVRVHIGDEEYIDRLSLSTRDMYARMRETALPVRTSQPPPGDFRRQFELLASHHDDVLSINISRKLSGTLQAAETAARHTSDRIRVVDCMNVSTGGGLAVLRAAELAHAGCTLDEIMADLDRVIPESRTYAVLDDLKYIVRGGRMSSGKKKLVDALHITPILRNTLDGRLGPGGILFGKRKVVPRFAHWIARHLDPKRDWRAFISHCDCEDRAAEFEAVLKREAPQIKRIDRLVTGTALGAHAGPGSVIIGVQPILPIPCNVKTDS